MKRRTFLQSTGALSAAALGAASPFSSFSANPAPALPEGLRIVFQGDSITDAGRDRGNYYANAGKGMGGGYVYQIASDLLGSNPEAQLRCYNRGISGHKVFQLASRWEIDCLALRPNVLSVLIGVNDFWHMLNGNYPGTVEVYERDFRALLQRTKLALPSVKFIIGEPFAVKGGTAINDRWEAFHAYRASAKKIAQEFNAAFIPYHYVFNEALKTAPVSYWCPDGVHPSIAGGHLMKEAWLKAFDSVM